MGDSSEMHFVEYDAKLVTEKFQNDLRVLTGKIEERSRSTGIIYQNLTPTWIPNSLFKILLFFILYSHLN